MHRRLEVFAACALAAVATGALPSRLSAQPGELWFEPVSVEDGLSHGAVWSIHQDSRGFLWIGTMEGLNRYDGYGFKVYKHHPDHPDSLSDSEILALAEDRAGGRAPTELGGGREPTELGGGREPTELGGGREPTGLGGGREPTELGGGREPTGLGGLWIGTRSGGLNRFDRGQERFEHFRHDPDDGGSLSHDAVWSLLEDSSGVLWIGTGNGLSSLQPPDDDFVRYPAGDGDDAAEALAGRTVNALLEDAGGALWIGTDAGLARLDSDRRSFSSYRHDGGDAASLSRGAVRALAVDHDGRLWIGTAGALSRYHPETGSFSHFRHDPADPGSLSDDEIRALHVDRRGQLWVGTETGGLNRFDLARLPASGGTPGAFADFRHDPATPGTLSNNSVISIAEDSTGVLWFGSYVGLDKHNPASERFVTYRQRPGHDQTLSSRAIWPILEDRSGALWVGTYESGLDRIDRERGRVDHFHPDPHDPASLPHGTVSSLWEDSAGVLWVGTWGGLARFDRARERLTTYRHDPENAGSLRSDLVAAVREDSAGRLWVGTLQGLHRFDRDGERFLRYPLLPTGPGGLAHDWIYSIYEERSGDLWFGAVGGGLYRLTGSAGDGRFTHYRHDRTDRDSLSSDKIASLYQDRSGRLWIGTFGGGLNRLASRGEPGDARFAHYWQEDGLANNTVLGILEDDAGNLWLSTNGGLSRFDPESETFVSFDVDDGLQGNVFSPGSCFRGRRGEMFFGGIGGLNSFFPERMATDPHPPAVVITDFQLFNESVALQRLDPDSPLEHSILETSRLELSHRHPVISFEFAALHFAKPRKNRYAYRLEGFDRDWVETGADKRFARYTNLAPGRYRFRVKGSNGDGVWNPEGTALDILVRPPPWTTWWAYGLYALVLSAAVAGYLRRHHREIEHERAINRRLKAADVAKEQLISELAAKNTELERFTYTVSHDLKTPLVTIQGFLGFVRRDAAAGNLERLDEDISRINGAVGKMRQLLEELLDLSRIGRVMNAPEHVPLGDLFREAEELLAGPIAERGAEIRISDDLPLVVGDRARLFQVIQNLLENALKYSDEPPRIEVGLDSSPASRDPVVFVRDHGIGIEARDLEEVFGLFKQLDSDRTGSGIGLALVKRIVEVHGGRIWVESEGRGHGSTFFLSLPRARQAEGEALP